MSTALLTLSPEPFSIVGQNTPIVATFTVELTATGRSLAMKVDGVTVLSWDGTTTTIGGGFGGSVVLLGTTLTATLTKTGGWTHGVGVAWSVGYSDSAANAVQRAGGHVYLTETLSSFTPASARGVSSRPWLCATASASGGTARGMDLVVNEVNAIEGGVVQTPAYEGFQGVAGGSNYASVRARRAFNAEQLVAVRVRQRVEVSAVVYRGDILRSFVVTGVGSRSPTVAALPRTAYPLLEATRQFVTSALCPSSSGPGLESVLPYYLRRSEIGALAASYAPDAPTPHATDIASFTRMTELVTQLTPLMVPLLHECARVDERESLLAAWRTGNVFEQVGAVCVLLVSHR